MLAVSLAVAAQVLKVLGLLLFAPLWLNLAAIAILAWLWSRVPQTASGAGARQPSPSATGRATAVVLVSIGSVIAFLCSISLFFAWDVALVPVLWIGPLALSCLAIGLDHLSGFRTRWSASVAGALRRRDVQLLCVIVLAGIVFRCASIGYFPPPDGFASIEEAQRGTGGQLILQTHARPWEWPLPQYSAAAAFYLFGYNIYALRAPALLVGCLTVIVFYLLARELVSAPAALFATALLAVSRWHVQVSWYNEDVYLPLFPFVIILYLLLRTRRVARPSLYVLLGALCGYTLYDYAGFRITFVVVIAFLLSELWHARGHLREWREWSVAATVFLLFAFPLIPIIQGIGIGGYLEAIGRALANKGYYTTDTSSFVAQRIERIRMATDMFTESDHGALLETLNAQQAPLLDPFTSVAFILGLGLTVVAARRRHFAFLAVTFFALATAATVLVPNLDFRRLAILIPFVFLFVAVLAQALADLCASDRARLILHGVLVVVVGLAAAANYHFLFDVLAPDPFVRSMHHDQYTVPAFYLHDHYHGEYVVLATSVMDNFFLSNDYDWIKPPGLAGRTVDHIDALVPLQPAPPSGRDVLILIQRPFDVEGTIAHIRTAYPGAACDIRPDVWAKRLDLGVCRLSSAVLSARAAR